MAQFGDDSIVFKQKLYENFKENGLLARLQTTLRTNLLEKIQKPTQMASQKQEKEVIEKKKPFHLRDKFIQSIFHDYLEKKGMQYTMSIFMPECQLDEDDCLSANEISEISNFPYQTEAEEDGLSFLQQLLKEWVKLRASQKRERSIQTDQSHECVSKKLEDIQKSYLAKIDYWKLIPNKQATENPSILDHELKLKSQFEAEKQKLKRDLEVSIRLQMEKKFEQTYAFKLNQITKDHQRRIDELKNREKAILTSLEQKKQQIAKKGRDLSNKELELIHKYETRQREIQAFYKGKENQIEKREKEFWKKELELKAKKRQYEDTIRLVKQKAIGEAGKMPESQHQSKTSTLGLGMGSNSVNPQSNTFYS